MSNEQWYRVQTVIRMTLCDEAVGTQLQETLGPQRTSIADGLRASRSRVDSDTRELVGLMADAIAKLESEVRRLQNELFLMELGLKLQPQVVHIGGDGLSLPRRVSGPSGTRLHLVFLLELRGLQHLVSLPVRVGQEEPNGHINLIFDGIRPDERDRIVAYVFQQQARERRRDRKGESS